MKAQKHDPVAETISVESGEKGDGRHGKNI